MSSVNHSRQHQTTNAVECESKRDQEQYLLLSLLAFRHQAVRDLAWVLLSPCPYNTPSITRLSRSAVPLISDDRVQRLFTGAAGGTGSTGNTAGAFRASSVRAWLQSLDADLRPLYRFLHSKHPKHMLLGELPHTTIES